MSAQTTDTQRTAVTTGAVRMALNRLDVSSLLGNLPLAKSDMVEERVTNNGWNMASADDRAYALNEIIREAIRTLFPETDGAKKTRTGMTALMGESLRPRYIERLSRTETSLSMSPAVTEAIHDRLHRQAIERLTAELRRRNDEARRRRSRENRIEQMIKPIQLLNQQGRHIDCLAACQKVFPVLYDAGLWEDYREVSEIAVSAAQASGQEARALEIRVANIARLHVDLRSFDEAEAETLVALTVAELQGMDRVQGEAYRILGIVKRERKDLAGSIADLKKSRDAFLRCKDPLPAAQIGGILAVDLRRDRQWKEAEEALDDQMACYGECDDPREKLKGEATTLCRKGTLHYEKALHGCAGCDEDREANLGKARECYGRALEMEGMLGRQRSIAVNSKKLALVELEPGDFAEARKCLEDAKRFFDSRGYPHEAVEIREIEARLPKPNK